MAQVQVVDRRLLLPPVSFGWVGELRPEQYRAVARLVRAGGGLLVAPPGAGKTHCGLAFVSQARQPALWLAHTKDLCAQAIERARNLWSAPRTAIGYVGEGERWVGTHLTVATVQTLFKQPSLTDALARRVGTIVIDECQHLPADSLRAVVSRFPGAYRLGLSATPSRSDGLGPMIDALIGGEVVRIELDELLRMRRVVLPEVALIPTRLRVREGLPWHRLQLARALNPERNEAVCAMVERDARAGGRVLLLVELIPHAQLLASALRRRGLPVWAVVGSVPRAARQAVYERMRRGSGVMVATKLADEGLDIPELDVLHLAAAGRSIPRLLQQVGRVMRAVGGKRRALVRDWVDASVPVLLDQAKDRLGVYREVGFPVRRQSS
jgi:superfamily II DNA or RNA helicase